MRLFKKIITAALVVSMLVPGIHTTTVYAETQEEKVDFPIGVTWEMTEASYWQERAFDADKVLHEQRRNSGLKS